MEKKRVVLVARDLMFTTKVRAAAQAMGRDVTVVRTAGALEEACRAGGVSRVIIDLALQEPDPFEAISKAKALQPGTSVTVFFSHVDTERAARATELGADEVMPRSEFSKRLLEIV